MSIFPAPIITPRGHAKFGPLQPPGRSAAPLRCAALAAGVLLSLAGPWSAAAETQTTGGGPTGVALAPGASARGEAVPGPHGAVTQRDVVESAELRFTQERDIASDVDVDVNYTVSETGDRVADADKGPQMVVLPAGELERILTVPTVDDDVHEPNSTVTVEIERSSFFPFGAKASDNVPDNDDPPTVSIGTPAAAAVEGEILSFPVTLDHASHQDITVEYSLGGDAIGVWRGTIGGVRGVGDFHGPADLGTLIIPAGKTRVDIELLTIVDDRVEGDEDVVVVLHEVGPPDGAMLGTTTATGVITDNDDPPEVTVADATASEDADLVFEVTLSPASSQEVSVQYAITPDTADAADYTGSTTGSVTFAPGEVEVVKQVVLDLVDDVIDEEDETVTLTLSDARGATVAEGVATGTITDNDDPPVLSIADATGPEGTDLVFAVTLTHPSSRDIEFRYDVTEGTATAGEDYTDASGELSIPAGEIKVDIRVATLDDDLYDDPDETFQVTISDPSPAGGATIGRATATGTITDNSAKPTVTVADVTAAEGTMLVFEVILSPASSNDISVEYEVTEGTATENDDYRGTLSGRLDFEPGQTMKQVELEIEDDDLYEPAETLEIEISNPLPATGVTIDRAVATGTITDNDDPPAVTVRDATAAEGDARLVFEVTLSLAGSWPVTVEYEFAPDTAQAADYTGPTSGAVTFAPGETAKEIALALVDDALAEENETVTLELANVEGGTLADRFATGTITDNDGTPAVTLGEDETASESDGSLVFPVTMSPASSWEVIVQYEFWPGTATENVDYTGPTSGSVTFAPGETAKEIALELVDDEIAEEDETVTLALTAVRFGVVAEGGRVLATGTITDNDAPTVTVADVTAAEGTMLVFEVVLSPASSNNISVEYEVTEGTATENTDYRGTLSGRLDFEPGQTVKRVELEIEDDDLYEPAETLEIEISNPLPATGVTIDRAVATGTITDNDDPPAVTVRDATAAEGDARLVFEVTLTPASSRPVSVEYEVTEGTATENADYGGRLSGELRFAPEETSKEIALELVDDAVAEEDETVTLTLSNVQGGTLAEGVATGTITDDDGTPAVTVGDASAAEGDGSLAFAVTLSPASSRAISVQYAVTEGTATENDDYRGMLSGRLEFAPGEMGKQIELELVDNDLYEPEETFEVAISEPLPTGGATIGRATATGTITDDDGTPTVRVANATAAEGARLVFEVTLSPASSQVVSLQYEVTEGTATENDDYRGVLSGELTFAPGETSTRVGLDLVDDAVAEEDETVTLELSNVQGGTLSGSVATGTITDNDGAPAIRVADAMATESDDNLVFAVTLSPASSQEVSLRYEVTGGTATENADYRGTLAGELTFAPRETSKEVELELVDDAVAEEDETVTLELTAVRGARLADGVATGVIADDDGTPAVRVADATAAEGDDSLVFEVTLSPASSQDVSLQYAVTGGTATENADYRGVLAGELTFAPGETSTRVGLDLVDDAVAEGNETVTLALSGVQGARLADGAATGTIVDDDGAPAIRVADATAAEGGRLVFAVTLSPASSREVSVQYAITPETARAADYTGPTSGTVTFAPGQAAKDVVLDLVDDALAESNETVTLSLFGVQGATLADGVATGTITDNDDAPAVRVADATAAEGDGRLVFAVALSPASSGEVSLQYAVTPGTATENADYRGASGSLTFAPGETAKEIALALVDDAFVEEDETVTLELSGVQGATLTDGVATGTIIDDDGTPTVRVADATAAEDASLVFVVTLRPASSQDVSVQYAITPGTAQAADYSGATSGTVTFAPGETVRDIVLDLVDDEIAEEDETVTLALSSVRGATLAEGAATGTITDNDGAPAVSVADATASEKENLVFEVTLSPASSREVSVRYAVTPGTAETADYAGATSGTVTFAPGETAKDVVLDLVDDEIAEEDETVTLALSAPRGATLADAAATGTILDDDLPRVTVAAEAGEVAEGGDAVFVLKRAGAATEALTVAFAVTGGDAVLASPPPTGATFEAGAATARVTLATEDDGAEEPDATVTLTLAGGAVYESGDPSRAAVVVRDDDDPPEASVGDSAAVPEGGALAFPVSLSHPADAAVTVDYVLGGTATAGDDYEGPAAGSVTFAPGETEKTILVATVDDELDEPDETLEVTLADGAAYDLGMSRAEGVILDDDDPPSVTISAAAGRIVEGEAVRFVLRRTGDVSESLTVELAVSERGGGDMVPAGSEGSRRATFAAGATTATLAVATTSDGVAGPDSEVTAMLAGGDGYEVGQPNSATVTVADGGGGSLLAEGRRLGAASLLRRHAQRFSQLTSVVALAVLDGGRPPSTTNLRASGDGVAASGEFGLDLPSGWNGWGSVRYSRLTESTDGGVRDFYAGGSRVGADGRSVYGALIGFESAPVTSRGIRLDARHAQLGLYGARRLGGTLILDGALGWGRGDSDLFLVGGPYPLAASHRSTRLVARGDLTGDFGWGGAGPRIEPQLGLLYAREDLDAFVDSLGGVAPGERLWLARIGFGPRLTWQWSDGATRASLRMNFDAHNLGPSGEDTEEVSAALELGHRWRLGARSSLDASAGVDGLGSDWFSSTSFGLAYEGAF